ncbi:MAG: hypothetical protein ABFD07_20440, partial [Methanobacterium sp.]
SVVRIFSYVGGKISGLWGKITNSKAYKAFTGIIDDSIGAIKGFFKSIADKIASVVKAATDGIKKLIPGGVKTKPSTGTGAKGAAKKSTGFFGKIASGAKSLVGKTASGITKVAKGAVAVGKGAVAVGKGVAKGAVAVGKGAVKMGLGAAKNVVKKAASGIISGAGGMFGVMGKLAAKGATKIPVIGGLIEGLFTASDIKKIKERIAKGEITESQAQEEAGKRVISGITGVIGSSTGAALAGTLGSIVPFAGTALGVILGGMAGDVAGRFLGGLISDYVLPKKFTKTIGAYVTKTTPPKDEMQDFIIKDGRIHKFSNKDEVMGIKSGGAINEFLKSNANVEISELVRVNSIANEYLRIIATNTGHMAKNKGNSSSSSSPVIVSNPQTSNSNPIEMKAIQNNRAGYLSSPYALG